MQTERRTCRGGIFIRTAEEAGLHDSLGEIDGPSTEQIRRMGEWAVCQDQKCGHVSVRDHHRSGEEGNGMHDTARLLLE